jgi:hypothetical protein
VCIHFARVSSWASGLVAWSGLMFFLGIYIVVAVVFGLVFGGILFHWRVSDEFMYVTRKRHNSTLQTRPTGTPPNLKLLLIGQS